MLIDIEKKTIPSIIALTNAGVEIRHMDALALRRCTIYDNHMAYFSIVEPSILHDAVRSIELTEGEDLWIASNEPSVIKTIKRRFESD